jgi:hypothetical protein
LDRRAQPTEPATGSPIRRYQEEWKQEEARRNEAWLNTPEGRAASAERLPSWILLNCDPRFPINEIQGRVF